MACSYAGKPIYARDLHAEGAMTALMKGCHQTPTSSDARGHALPDARRSVRQYRTRLQTACRQPSWHSSWVILPSRRQASALTSAQRNSWTSSAAQNGLAPDCIVLVATVRALKYNGGVAKADLNQPNMDALEHGICNLDAHLDNMKKFGVPVVVAVNAFPTDTDEEMDFIRGALYARRGVRASYSRYLPKGGEGGQALADGFWLCLTREQGRLPHAVRGFSSRSRTRSRKSPRRFTVHSA